MSLIQFSHPSGTYAKVIKDSISPDGVRLLTIEVRFHRFILAELNTHRMFSRNSASSRAIPVFKQMERVDKDPAWPVYWGKNRPGMQATEEMNEDEIESCKIHYRKLQKYTIETVKSLERLGLHKQLANRRLEPDMWHTAIITATEWDNFFHQRCHPDAQPEMKALADVIQLCFFTSVPTTISYHGWHLPYIDHNTANRVSVELCAGFSGHEREVMAMDYLKQISVARCARVSYMNIEGKSDIYSDINLYNKLTEGMHWSPFEHVACPMQLLPPQNMTFVYGDGAMLSTNDSDLFNWSGNFYGWKQFRKFFQQENRSHFIPNLPELAHVAERMKRQVAQEAEEMLATLEGRDDEA